MDKFLTQSPSDCASTFKAEAGKAEKYISGFWAGFIGILSSVAQLSPIGIPTTFAINGVIFTGLATNSFGILAFFYLPVYLATTIGSVIVFFWGLGFTV